MRSGSAGTPVPRSASGTPSYRPNSVSTRGSSPTLRSCAREGSSSTTTSTLARRAANSSGSWFTTSATSRANRVRSIGIASWRVKRGASGRCHTPFGMTRRSSRNLDNPATLGHEKRPRPQDCGGRHSPTTRSSGDSPRRSPMLLDGKVVVITGAGRGIGREEALLMGKLGAKVVVNDLGGNFDGSGASTGPAQEVVDEIKKNGGQAVANGDSVSDFKGAQHILECAIDTFGKLTGVVNNAGILRDRMIFNMSEDDWDSVIAVHLKGTFNCTRHACVYWREQHKAGNVLNGRIINTASDSGLLGNPSQSNYGAAKAAIAAFSIIIDREMAKYGVSVNCIA